ncbi:hypothetical protein JMM59_19760 [Rhodovulum sulfidophilum]|uniref:hypothetical protein n=1 Tax=Rhodovulum sulfidophilum TaxID=35806 RepID=UPI0019231EA9|nr:hypothetical protein [Rhodovulum sulfidophilum]MBL3567226.1 hypothetical protein [Rhodovulum sulfidophilum]
MTDTLSFTSSSTVSTWVSMTNTGGASKGWAAPFILYNAKLLIWDNVLVLDATDALSADLLDLQLRIVTFYFGGAAAIGVVRALRR